MYERKGRVLIFGHKNKVLYLPLITNHKKPFQLSPLKVSLINKFLMAHSTDHTNVKIYLAKLSRN